MKRIYLAMLNSFRGLAHAFRTEAAVRQEAIAFLFAVPVGYLVAPNAAWYVAMIGVLLVLLAVELLNTAIEKLADHLAPEIHPRIGFIKDMGSAAVFCMLTLTGLIWLAALATRASWLG